MSTPGRQIHDQPHAKSGASPIEYVLAALLITIIAMVALSTVG